MAQIRTYYDDLQVSRTASDELIKAAYRRLSTKFHPDRNAGDAACAEVMKILNASYQVLSNPALRKKHDEWIKASEAASAANADHRSNPNAEGLQRAWAIYSERARHGYTKRTALGDAGLAQPKKAGSATKGAAHADRSKWIMNAVSVVALIASGFYVGSRPSDLSGFPPSVHYAVTTEESTTVSENSLLNEPFGPQSEASDSHAVAVLLESSRTIATAPNGSPWPEEAGYVAGYPHLRTSGHSPVTVDNSSNSADVFVKLVEIGSVKLKAIRHIYIPRYGTFDMESVPPGTYEIRYMDLSDGSLAKSESFELRQSEDDSGITYSNVTIFLNKVLNGNTQTYPLDPSEF